LGSKRRSARGGPKIIQRSDARLRGRIEERDICPTLKAGTKAGDTEPLVIVQKHQDWRQKGEPLRKRGDVCPTLRSNMGDNIPMVARKRKGGFVDNRLADPEGISPTLMSVPNTGGNHQAGMGQKTPCVIVPPSASATARSTPTPSPSTGATGRGTGTSGTQLELIPPAFRTSTFSLADFRARISVLLENAEGSLTPGDASFLRLCGSLGIKDLSICSLRMSSGSSRMMRDAHSWLSSRHWTRWGMMRSGKLAMANIGFHRTGTGFSLSDILEEDAPARYFLSEKALRSAMERIERAGEKGNGWQQPWIPATPRDRTEKDP